MTYKSYEGSNTLLLLSFRTRYHFGKNGGKSKYKSTAAHIWGSDWDVPGYTAIKTSKQLGVVFAWIETIILL
jgi:hypothetical protein